MGNMILKNKMIEIQETFIQSKILPRYLDIPMFNMCVMVKISRRITWQRDGGYIYVHIKC